MDKPLSRTIKMVQNRKITEEVPTRMTRRNVKNPKYRTKTGAFDQAAYDADKQAVGTKKGGGRPRKKGGALATTTGSSIEKTGSSSIEKTGSSSMTTTDKKSGVTKSEPEAKDQTISVKATEVGGDLAKNKSKAGSIANSGKKKVDPKKNDITSKNKSTKQLSGTSNNDKKDKARARLRNIRKIRRVKRAKEINKELNPLVTKAVSKIPDAMKSTTSAFGTSSFSKEGVTFKEFKSSVKEVSSWNEEFLSYEEVELFVESLSEQGYTEEQILLELDKRGLGPVVLGKGLELGMSAIKNTFKAGKATRNFVNRGIRDVKLTKDVWNTAKKLRSNSGSTFKSFKDKAGSLVNRVRGKLTRSDVKTNTPTKTVKTQALGGAATNTTTNAVNNLKNVTPKRLKVSNAIKNAANKVKNIPSDKVKGAGAAAGVTAGIAAVTKKKAADTTATKSAKVKTADTKIKPLKKTTKNSDRARSVDRAYGAMIAQTRKLKGDAAAEKQRNKFINRPITSKEMDEGVTTALSLGAKALPHLPKVPSALKAIGAGAATGAAALKLKNVFKSKRTKGSAIPNAGDEFIRSSGSDREATADYETQKVGHAGASGQIPKTGKVTTYKKVNNKWNKSKPKVDQKGETQRLKDKFNEEGKSVFSTPYADKLKNIEKWKLNNDKLYKKWGLKKAHYEPEGDMLEATRYKKEKGYDKGGTKKPSGKQDKALSFVLDRIRKEHGKGAVIGQGSKQQKKVKGAKSSAGTGKYKKAADAKKQTASDAKKRGFKSSQDYVNTIARHGGKDNYDKGRGLGT